MPAPMGCCGQSGQRINPAKPIFLLPWGCFSLISRGSGCGTALHLQLPATHEESPVGSGTVLVGGQLSHQSTCTLLGCLLEAVYTMLWTLPHLPRHANENVALLTNKVRVKNAEKQGPCFVIPFLSSAVSSILLLLTARLLSAHEI